MSCKVDEFTAQSTPVRLKRWLLDLLRRCAGCQATTRLHVFHQSIDIYTRCCRQSRPIYICTVVFVFFRSGGAIPRVVIKSAKSGFHFGTSSSICRKTLFMRSVRAAFGNPPKYSN